MRVWYQIVVSCMILKGRGHIIVPKQIIFLCKPIAHEECNIPFATLILLENGKRTIEDRLLVWGNGEESEKLYTSCWESNPECSEHWAITTELWPPELWPPELWPRAMTTIPHNPPHILQRCFSLNTWQPLIMCHQIYIRDWPEILKEPTLSALMLFNIWTVRYA